MPKLKLDGLAVIAPAVTPLPLSVQVRGDPGAFEATLTVPEALVAVKGANVTLKVVLWPAGKVNGVVIPLNVKPVPVMLALLMVTLDPPELVMVAVCFWFCPTCTVPNAMTLDPVVNDPGATALPESARLSEGFEALLVMAIFPVALPVVFGAKFTEKLALWPAGIVAEALIPVKVKPLPVTAAWLIVTLAEPVFCKTTVELALALT